MNEFFRWEQALQSAAWRNTEFHDPLLRRWKDAVMRANERTDLYGPGNLDVAVLTRQVLRRESEWRGYEVNVLIPRESFWPTGEQWASCSVRVLSANPKYFQIEAQPWQPAFASGLDPSRAALAEEKRRHQHPVPADPRFRRMTGFGAYSSPGQRQAVRAVWYAPPRTTVAAVLPTGSGKSAVAHVPALEYAQERKLSVLIVPTVALAMDQEHALLELAQQAGVQLPGQLTYHGGLSQGQRLALRQRIQQGQQGVVITSPESLVSSLSASLLKAAEQGQLALFTLDEAHLAVQWGRDFRPEFQLLAGLRRSLLQSCPPGSSFTTLLLSATITAGDLGTLEQLFSEPGHFQLVAGVKLRAEPEYWAASYPSNAQRQEALDDAIRHLPRPMIVYTTMVADAAAHHKRLKAQGYRRIGLLTGESSTRERQRVVSDWRQGKLDVVVGTSAFGVGIDQAHVRTVLHACIPENADRYYQEVGRGGRDGRAALALTLSTTADWEVARGMAVPTLVTIDVGLARWQEMFHRKLRQVNMNTFDIDLRVNPPHIIYSGKTSRGWNRYTLNLMARAGLIRLHHPPFPALDPSLDDAPAQDRLEEYQWTQRAEILHPAHLDRHTWEAHVEPVRHREMAASINSLHALEQLLGGEREAGDLLVNEYQVDTHLSIQPQHACGGCPVCRAEGMSVDPGLDPMPLVDHWRQVETGTSPWFAADHLTVVTIEASQDLTAVLRRAVQGGAVVIVDPSVQLPPEEALALQEHMNEPLLLEEEPYLVFAPPLPRILIADPSWTSLPDDWLTSPLTLLIARPGQNHFDSGDSLRGHPHVRIHYWKGHHRHDTNTH
ncbi:DEAD/DEAH box helicase (plasmid) [Deinococcus taeanensis]|uniref:protein DpdF n=1 Tax=Deinococcus taeanensis TaxID=2737050 RepID=UPI001CDBF765|nr:protein DpdF [Deinococcus taeanensis]UBV45517.1 DEAD/DEAH box helicase [Deinococcus taeanensis]